MRGYTCPKRIRGLAELTWQNSEPGARIARVTLERWVTTRMETARAAGLLLTDRQWQDREDGRLLHIGDRTRFVGPTRFEDVGQTFVRPHGQVGEIVKALLTGDDNRVLWFRPDDHAAPQLVVRQGDPSYWTLERTE